MTKTHEMRMARFTTARGNAVEVFCVKTVEKNATGFTGFGKTVRTFARVAGTEVECEPSCVFQASSRVVAAGF